MHKLINFHCRNQIIKDSIYSNQLASIIQYCKMIKMDSTQSILVNINNCLGDGSPDLL